MGCIPSSSDLGPLQVNAWGVMAALAALAAARVAGAELQRRGHARADAWPLVLAGAIGGLIGAKLYFLAQHPDRITDAADLLSGEGFAVELVRRNEEILAGVTQPQLWALGGALAGLALLAAARPRRPPQPVATAFPRTV